jgi:hypothetical protein
MLAGVLAVGACATVPPATVGVREAMPVLARHEGTWTGTFRRYDADGALVEAFPSEIVTTFPNENDYLQVNRYTRPAGQPEIVIRSEGRFDGERLRFENPRVRGWAMDDPSDEKGRSVLLYFEFLDGSGVYVYETVQISDDGRSRHRATQYFNPDGSLQRRTLIDEQRKD